MHRDFASGPAYQPCPHQASASQPYQASASPGYSHNSAALHPCCSCLPWHPCPSVPCPCCSFPCCSCRPCCSWQPSGPVEAGCRVNSSCCSACSTSGPEPVPAAFVAAAFVVAAFVAAGLEQLHELAAAAARKTRLACLAVAWVVAGGEHCHRHQRNQSG